MLPEREESARYSLQILGHLIRKEGLEKMTLPGHSENKRNEGQDVPETYNHRHPEGTRYIKEEEKF